MPKSRFHAGAPIELVCIALVLATPSLFSGQEMATPAAAKSVWFTPKRLQHDYRF